MTALALILAAVALGLALGVFTGRRLRQHRRPVRVPPAHPRWDTRAALDETGDQVDATVFRPSPDRPAG